MFIEVLCHVVDVAVDHDPTRIAGRMFGNLEAMDEFGVGHSVDKARVIEGWWCLSLWPRPVWCPSFKIQSKFRLLNAWGGYVYAVV